MKRIILIACICLVAISISPFASLAQQRSQFGGRPGEFHFILKEQADHNRAEFREMHLRVERMKADVLANTANDESRKRMLSNLDSFELFVASMEAQLSLPVGQTAGEVETRLNLVKGQANCGTCHEDVTVRGAR
jgi:hypothetical protein